MLYVAEVVSGHIDWKVVALGRKSPMSPTVDKKNSCSDFFPQGLPGFLSFPGIGVLPNNSSIY